MYINYQVKNLNAITKNRKLFCNYLQDNIKTTVHDYFKSNKRYCEETYGLVGKTCDEVENIIAKLLRVDILGDVIHIYLLETPSKKSTPIAISAVDFGSSKTGLPKRIFTDILNYICKRMKVIILKYRLFGGRK